MVENSEAFRLHFGLIAVALLLFGVLFNSLTAWLHRNGLKDGYTWLLVAAGVTVTLLAGGFLIGWQAVGILFVLFSCSGLPMALGDAWRHKQAVREFVQYRSRDDTTEAVGE